MRTSYALAFCVLLGACRVTEDPANDQVTVQLNGDVAENTAETVVNETETTAEAIANDAERIGGQIENRVERIDVDVDANKAN